MGNENNYKGYRFQLATIPQALRASQCTLQNSPPRPCAVSFRNGISMPLLANRPRTLSRLIIKSASPQATATASMAEVNLDYKAVLPDYNFLCSLYFQTASWDAVCSTIARVRATDEGDIFLALEEKGLIIELGFEDLESQLMLELVETMGYVPDAHSSTQGALWDVTYKPSGVMSAKTGTTAHSHSHGDGEFSWHTEGCFEARPQRFFGLHVVHPDTFGGGIFRVLPAKDLIGALSPQSVEALLRTEFDIQVPAEFYKGQATIKGRHYLLRFRRDVLADPPSTDPASNAAIAELIFDNPETKGWRLSDDIFKENVVILMDNALPAHTH
ncbi:hypothetical protein B0H14DRAFT_3433830 [Mycena olivaceomarginata]|nr:hypothetical protein B0H14DRAFT_3433830 [Mycena olivaceomarginata]